MVSDCSFSSFLEAIISHPVNFFTLLFLHTFSNLDVMPLGWPLFSLSWDSVLPQLLLHTLFHKSLIFFNIQLSTQFIFFIQQLSSYSFHTSILSFRLTFIFPSLSRMHGSQTKSLLFFWLYFANPYKHFNASDLFRSNYQKSSYLSFLLLEPQLFYSLFVTIYNSFDCESPLFCHFF